jgi:hypothetical protein
MCVDFHVRYSRLNLWHVAGDALTSCAAVFVVSVLFERGSAGSIGRQSTVAVQTYLVGGFSQLRVIVRAVRVVATEACHAAPIHNALDEVVALHPIFVPGAFREMREACHAQCVVFQFPEIL